MHPNNPNSCYSDKHDSTSLFKENSTQILGSGYDTISSYNSLVDIALPLASTMTRHTKDINVWMFPENAKWNQFIQLWRKNKKWDNFVYVVTESAGGKRDETLFISPRPQAQCHRLCHSSWALHNTFQQPHRHIVPRRQLHFDELASWSDRRLSHSDRQFEQGI